MFRSVLILVSLTAASANAASRNSVNPIDHLDAIVKSAKVNANNEISLKNVQTIENSRKELEKIYLTTRAGLETRLKLKAPADAAEIIATLDTQIGKLRDITIPQEGESAQARAANIKLEAQTAIDAIVKAQKLTNY